MPPSTSLRPSVPPSLPSFPSPSAINHPAHSLGQCQGRNAHRVWRKRAAGLRGEKRDRDRKEGMKGRGWRHLKAWSLIPKCNTPISMLICSVTAEMDVCDFLADVMHTYRGWSEAIRLAAGSLDVEGKWFSGSQGNKHSTFKRCYTMINIPCFIWSYHISLKILLLTRQYIIYTLYG